MLSFRHLGLSVPSSVAFSLGIQVRVVKAMIFSVFLRVCPVHFHLIRILSHTSSVVNLSVHLLLSRRQRHLLMKVCNRFTQVCVAYQVAYINIDLVLELKSLTFNWIEISFDRQILVRDLKAFWALHFLASISASVPLSRPVNCPSRNKNQPLQELSP